MRFESEHCNRMPGDDEKNGEVPTDINALIVKLPTFWSSNPRTWFVQAEAQFALGKVTSDAGKYNYVVATLPQEVAEIVADVLENPPATDRYKNLKDTLIDRHSLSMESRIRKLVSDEEMGDKKPSEYFGTLQRLAGNSGTIGQELLKKLWLGRLPQSISVALVSQDALDMESLTKLADRVWEAIKTANVSAVSTGTSNDDLRAEISELRAMIEKLSFGNSQRNSDNRYRGRSPYRESSRSNSSNRGRSRSRGPRFNPKGKFCFDHFKFGNRATKCTQPCAFVNAQSSSKSSNPN